ncbi:hypothetical protein GUJ93_ZPchr0009g77 [Zizania palustris]|uniref:Uncharacterized protein n=1 Tax=Zizania palustris TaxID=103762 RepID=A0A8J5V957_ZIZPA|nr:hypothetical protein GUJ93_ZPchr0009g77 [Zizania palustris]
MVLGEYCLGLKRPRRSGRTYCAQICSPAPRRPLLPCTPPPPARPHLAALLRPAPPLAAPTPPVSYRRPRPAASGRPPAPAAAGEPHPAAAPSIPRRRPPSLWPLAPPPSHVPTPDAPGPSSFGRRLPTL